MRQCEDEKGILLYNWGIKWGMMRMNLILRGRMDIIGTPIHVWLEYLPATARLPVDAEIVEV